MQAKSHQSSTSVPLGTVCDRVSINLYGAINKIMLVTIQKLTDLHRALDMPKYLL